MTTASAGGRITGHLALTVAATAALNENDPVMLTGDYQVGLCDGTKPSIGYVSVKNVKRVVTDTASTFPVGNPGGDVTIEARGLNVGTFLSGGAIVAGNYVKVNNAGAYVDGGVVWAVGIVGIALVHTTAAGQSFDCLAI